MIVIWAKFYTVNCWVYIFKKKILSTIRPTLPVASTTSLMFFDVQSICCPPSSFPRQFEGKATKNKSQREKTFLLIALSSQHQMALDISLGPSNLVSKTSVVTIQCKAGLLDWSNFEHTFGNIHSLSQKLRASYWRQHSNRFRPWLVMKENSSSLCKLSIE